ncbi:hypothetical protein ACWT_1389 [Actinoplanes sp. SE50]|uniref:hypothetical protein n=1 Tax=unclassified Actinoplanes TaxID=2626549 RepID=UPI00023EC050|nr:MULTISPECIES: hypothetical protein [unclassified Actinoplanes]AEV82407.1 hypothetical protein ACPL_1510 [Actinoplanes sp. SE50/110]ATO80804.1 hypothetical protein ACWT_1389 [Actinoplanes sp. SE50]SLL98212.1 uncharacterized protein ACSP50_1436 [Actinoplanes sp. SE50/110]
MFATRKNRAERTAGQAWEYLSAAVASAGETAKDQAGEARKAARQGRKAAAGKAAKVNKQGHRVADEARSRATAAANALAGRKPGRPWGLLAAIGLLGLAAGWAAATTTRAALEREAENEQLELAETAVVVTPTADK